MRKAWIWSVMVVVILGASVLVFADSDEKGPVKMNTVSVPNVVGMLGGKGRQAVENAGLKWAYASQGIPVTDPNKNAIVASQSPNAGAQAIRGSTVTLTLYVFSEKALRDNDQKGTVNLPRR
ncbi:MAG TPA: PASTA domain-containing protein [Syntrophorhabdales bacterium]|nr:PASTA domain-containing protein [Syntrophorhabdales bacterium]